MANAILLGLFNVKNVKSFPNTLIVRLIDYALLIKVRLSLLVVFSSAMAYLWATNRNVDVLTIWLLSTGGFAVTGSANILNQIFERRSDKLMKRTRGRPLPANRMQVKEAILLAFFLGFSGLFLLFVINALCAILGLAALIFYAGIYTPLKQVSGLSVIPGAIAGSLPVVIGSVAATGHLSQEALLLFSIQFIWQFPHTWSIAWLLHDDYNKAGIKLLPVSGGKNTASAILIMISTFLIIPFGLLLNMYGSAGIKVSGILALAGIVLTLFSYKLYRYRTDKTALRLMLGSFVYLPLVLILLVAEKFLLR